MKEKEKQTGWNFKSRQKFLGEGTDKGSRLNPGEDTDGTFEQYEGGRVYKIR